MPRLLIVHHTPSPALQEMFEAAVSGARTDEIEGVEVVIRPALTAAAVDVLTANGILLGTPANIGYMSGRSLWWSGRPGSSNCQAARLVR
jgi:multimeric flavodoxin WrbA